MLLLTDADVEKAVTMADAIAAIAEGSRDEAAGSVLIGERQNVRYDGGWIRLMPAVLIGQDVVGYKEFHLAVDQANPNDVAWVRYTINLFRLSTGEALASIDGNKLTALRTGAASGVATASLAVAGAKTLGIIGSGAEARSQAESVAAVRSIESGKVYGRDPDRRARYAEEMTARLGFPIEPASRPEEVAAGVDVLVVATLTDGTPAMYGRWLEPGTHVVSVGSTMPTQREIDPEVWERAHRIVVDTDRLFSESGDALAAIEAGTLDRSRVRLLHELVAGTASGRVEADEITLYKSVGTGMQDIALANLAYRRAVDHGLGTEIDDHRSVKTVLPN